VVSISVARVGASVARTAQRAKARGSGRLLTTGPMFHRSHGAASSCAGEGRASNTSSNGSAITPLSVASVICSAIHRPSPSGYAQR
jgi:hypothetical protein